MKEMRYLEIQKRELLHEDKYKGYKYYIISLGSHPVVYVDIPRNKELYCKDYFDAMENYGIEVHGGFTYSKGNIIIAKGEEKEGWFLGWDYNHYGDCNSFYGNPGKFWTTEEIDKECRYVIDQIIKIDERGE